MHLTLQISFSEVSAFNFIGAEHWKRGVREYEWTQVLCEREYRVPCERELRDSAPCDFRGRH